MIQISELKKETRTSKNMSLVQRVVNCGISDKRPILIF